MQIVLLWAGLLLLAVGAAIAFLEARALRSGIVAAGRVVGHSESAGNSGRMYHAVIEFVDLQGRRRLIESPLGSSLPIGRAGDSVRVALSRENPDRATVESRGTLVLGLVLALMGAVCCGVFFATFRADLFNLLASAAVTAVAGFKAAHLYSKFRALIPGWREIGEQAITSRTIDPQGPQAIAWAKPEALEAAARQQRTTMRFAHPVLLAGGFGLLFLGWHLHRTTSEFLAHAVPGSGHVVDLAADASSGGTTTYAAVVEFEAFGARHTFKDSLAANPPIYRTGDVVPIRYLPGDLRVARIDRGIWSRLFPALVGGFGALMALGGLGARSRPRPAQDRGGTVTPLVTSHRPSGTS